MTLVRRWVAIAVVVPLLVSGCSDDPEPTFEEPTETPSPTETTSEPSEPEAWEVRSKAGAYEFVEHWVQTLNLSGAAGNTDELAALSRSSCGTCANLIEYIDEVYGEGGSIRGRGWDVVQMGEIAGGASLSRPTIATRIRQGAQVVHRTGPSETLRVPPETVSMSFSLRWDSGWTVADAVIVG